MKKVTKKIKIIRDSREKNPLTFSELTDHIEIAKDTLIYGDYTVAGHDMVSDDNSIIIERKKDTLELVNNIGADWERFERELIELSKYKYKKIVVCGPCNIEYLYDREFTKINPPFFYRQLSYIYTYYDIPTLFFDNRDQVENYLSRFFYQVVKKTQNEN